MIKLIDKLGNIKKPTVYFSNKALQVIGVINNIDYSSLIYKNSDFVPEASFNVYKELNGVKCRFWDDLEALSIVYFKEYNTYFECEVDIDEEDSIYKKITCTFLPVAELSQVNLYNVEINTEDDIKNDDFTGASQFYNPSDHKRSILHRIIDNFAPHYTLDTVVPSTLKQLQRSFSFSNESVYNALNKIEQEIGCKFIYDSANRKISVIDMYSTCNKCGFRGEFYTECPICGSKDITLPYGKKTSIFFSNRNLSKRVVVSAEEKDIKNTFYLVTGDEDMDTAVMALNPSGTRYLYCFTDSLRKKFTPALRTAIESYEDTYGKINASAYPLTSNGLSADDANAFNKIVDKYNAEAFYDLKYDKNDNKVLMGNEFLKADSATSYQELVLLKSSIDEMNSYLTHSLEPVVKVDLKTAKGQAEQVKQAGDFELGIIGYDANKSDDYTKRVQSGVKQIVNICLSSGYKVEIKNITYGDIISSSPSARWWNFTITLIKYSDDTDKADVDIRVKVSAGYDTYLTNYMDRTLNSERDMSGVYRVLYHKGTDEDITNALAFFSSQRLSSFYTAYDEALNAINSSNAGNDKEKQEITKQVYDKYKHTQELIKAELDERTAEIATVKKAKDICDKIIKEKRDILNFDKYLKDKNVFNEYFAYRREDEYSNSNYVSTDLTYKEMMRRASDFLAVAREEINKASRTIYTIEGTLNNFLVLPAFEDKVKELGIYDFITYRVDNKLFRLRLISYEITFNESSIDELELKFSNGIEGLTVDSLSETAKILQNAKDVSGHYNAMKTQMGLNEREIQGAVDRAYGLTGNFYNANANFNQLSANNLTVNGRLDANEANIHDLTSDNVTIKNKLTAHEGEFDELKTHNLTVDDKLTAHEADIKNLHTENTTVTGRLDANEANIKTLTGDYANINKIVTEDITTDIATINNTLTAHSANISDLQVDYENVDKLVANKAEIKDLDATNANVKNLQADYENVNTLVAKKIDADEVNSKFVKAETLEADYTKTKDLEAEYTKTTDLEAKYATIENLNADTAKINSLVANKIDASEVKANYAQIKDIETDYTKTTDLEAKYATIDNLNADKAELNTVIANKIDSKEVNANFVKTKDLEANYTKTTDLEANYATIDNLNTQTARIDTLEGDSATFKDTYTKNLTADRGRIDTLEGDSATFKDTYTKNLTADRGRITTLETGYEKVGILDGDVANIKAIMAGNVGTGTLQTITLNTDNATLANGMIKSAMIENLSFDKITGFDVNTKKVTVHSDDGLSTWKDNTISIKDSNKTVRVQIGKDAEGDYNMYIWDKNGKLMFDPLGITKDGINRQVIDNDAVADDAMIAGSKLDINSVVKSINANTGDQKLSSNSITVDEKTGTLTAVLNEMTTGISDNLGKINSTNKQVSNVSDKANNAYDKANNAYNLANTANGTASTALNTANSAMSQANAGMNKWLITEYDTNGKTEDIATIPFLIANRFNQKFTIETESNYGPSISGVNLSDKELYSWKHLDYDSDKLTYNGDDLLYSSTDEYSVSYIISYFKFSDDVTITNFSMFTDDFGTLYLNGKQLIHNSKSGYSNKLSITFNKGWNAIEVIVQNNNLDGGFKFSTKNDNNEFVDLDLTKLENFERMDCYCSAFTGQTAYGLAVNSKVIETNSSLETVSRTVTDNKNGINDLMTRTSQVETNVINLNNLENTHYSILKTQYNDQQKTIEGTITRLGNAETKITTVSNDLSNLSIGGRNLAKNTNLNECTVTTKTTDNATWGSGSSFNGSNAYIPFGSTYRASVDVWLPVEGTIKVDINNYPSTGDNWNSNDNDNVNDRTSTDIKVHANTWTRISWGSSNTDSRNVNKVPIRVEDGFGLLPQNSDITWKFRGLKVELGNRPTDWSPAPEDFENAITEQSTALATYKQTTDQNLAQISSTYQRKDGMSNYATNSSVTSAINQAKNEITTSVSSNYVKTADYNTNKQTIEARMSSAEQKITDSEIISTVTKSANWADLQKNASKLDWQKITTAVDLNNMKTDGRYLLQGSITNGYTGISGWQYLIVDSIESRVTQTIWHDDDTESGYVRKLKSDGKWTTWIRESNTGNAISVINQSAEDIKIQANRVDIDGLVTFNSGNNAIANKIADAKKAGTDASNLFNNWKTDNNIDKKLNHAYALVNRWAQDATSDTTTINGGLIQTNTITADKIAVSDLYALGATIGNFVIENDKIRSSTKNSYDDNNKGIVLQSTPTISRVGIGAKNGDHIIFDEDGLNISVKNLNIIKNDNSQTSFGDYINDATNGSIIGYEYIQTNSATTKPSASDTGWSNTMPSWKNGYYIWERSIQKNGGQTIKTDPLCISGSKGDKGDQGIQGDSYTTEIKYVKGGNIMDDSNKIDILEAIIRKNGAIIEGIDAYKICWYINDKYVGNGKTYTINSEYYPDYESDRWNVYFVYDDDKIDSNRLIDDGGNYITYNNDNIIF